MAKNLSRVLTEDNAQTEQAVRQIIWGALGHVHGVETRYDAHETPEGSTEFRLEVTYFVPALRKHQRTAAVHLVSDYELRFESGYEIATGVLKNLVCQIAPRLFEIDPRIGTEVTGHLSRCPLFDPPNMNTLARTGDVIRRTIEKGGAAPMAAATQLESYLVEGHDGAKCPFCDQVFMVEDPDDEIIWAGGNLGWVHVKCHPTIRKEPHSVKQAPHGIADGVIRKKFRHPARNARFDFNTMLPSEPVIGQMFTEPATGIRKIYTEAGWKTVV